MTRSFGVGHQIQRQEAVPDYRGKPIALTVSRLVQSIGSSVDFVPNSN